MNDILIYTETLIDHMPLVKEVLGRLRTNRLQANLRKSVFEKQEVEFVGFMVISEGLQMSDRKIEAVQSWLKPRTAKNIQEFLEFANFYRRFIKNFSQLAHPLTQLTKKDEPWRWSAQCEKAFADMKKRFCEVPILAHFQSE